MADKNTTSVEKEDKKIKPLANLSAMDAINIRVATPPMLMFPIKKT